VIQTGGLHSHQRLSWLQRGNIFLANFNHFGTAGPQRASHPSLCNGTHSTNISFAAAFFLDVLLNLIYDVVEMAANASLGEFEQVTLLAILRLGDDAYGVTIRAEIAECTGRDPAPGALYTTFDRLQQKGLVTSRLGDPTPQRGGRAKRFFTVTAAGIQAVANAQRSYQRLMQGISLPGILPTGVSHA
jgi:DNA-binding PadR family transcriptional regulator